MAVTAEQLIKIQGPRHTGYGPVKASTTIYGGTMVFVEAASGLLVGDDAAGANAFAGIAKRTYDNSAGANGAVTAEMWTEGDVELVGTGFDQADNHVDIYATDNYTITTTASNASYIGRSVAFVSATRLIVRLETTPTFDGVGGT